MEQSDTKLIAIVYPDMQAAEDVLAKLQNLEKKYLIDIDDATYVIKNKEGKVTIHQTGHPVGGPAAGGAFWGLLIGTLFLVPIFGMLMGAASGALAGSVAGTGVDKEFTETISKKLQPGTSALFILIRTATADRVIPEISEYGGEVIQTNLSKKAEAELQKQLRGGQSQNSSRQHMAN